MATTPASPASGGLSRFAAPSRRTRPRRRIGSGAPDVLEVLSRDLTVMVYREGNPEVRHQIQQTVQLRAAQASWAEFMFKVRQVLGLAHVEGIYSEYKLFPVYCAKTLVDGTTYVARPTENCALTRSLPIEGETPHPAWPIVEKCREGRAEIARNIEKYPETTKGAERFAEFRQKYVHCVCMYMSNSHWPLAWLSMTEHD